MIERIRGFRVDCDALGFAFNPLDVEGGADDVDDPEEEDDDDDENEGVVVVVGEDVFEFAFRDANVVGGGVEGETGTDENLARRAIFDSFSVLGDLVPLGGGGAFSNGEEIGVSSIVSGGSDLSIESIESEIEGLLSSSDQYSTITSTSSPSDEEEQSSSSSLWVSPSRTRSLFINPHLSQPIPLFPPLIQNAETCPKVTTVLISARISCYTSCSLSTKNQ